ETYSRALKYRNKSVKLPDGKAYSFLSASEKGIDIRIALDVIRSAILKEYDVALIFSQDQDFTEVADEVRLIAVEQDRWIKVASAYPSSPTNRNTRGINKTEWIKIDRATYDACLDVP
ncbi:MAG: NYN domain-containing protein, partial [Elusimicrobia bacterium]|nr:NYN domain-containing protein [Elusimicrobiota bacterium]